MEYWSVGVLEYWKKEAKRQVLFCITIIPILHYSNTPVSLRGK